MAHHWSEGVSSLRFTAREFQLELIEEALKHNLLTCPPVTTGFFVTLKLIQELAYQIRSPSTKKTVILVPLYQVKALAVQLCHLTDLQTIGLLNCDLSDKKLNIYEIIVCTSEVLDNVLTKSIISISNINLLVIEQCHMIVKDAHLQNIMSYYLKENSNLSLSSMSPKILAFTYPLFTPHDNENPEKTVKQAKELLHEYRKEPPSNHAAIFSSEDEMQSSEPYVELECLKGFSQFGNSDEDPESMEMNSFRFWHTPLEDIVIDEVPEAEPEEVAIEEICEEVIVEKKNPERSIYDMVEYRLEHLERVLSCKTDLAADIVGLKRITGKPKEIILECESILEDDHCEDRVRLEKYMKSVIAGALVFLSDHRYDPTEIYGCETYDEELKAIPNPCTEPRQMLELFLYVLDEMGAYAADKAAFILLIKLEKLKIKIPYERHFLLLCLVSSAFIQIRAAAEMIFENYTTDKDKISTFSTLKVLRLLDILKLFKPKEVDNKSSKYSGSKVDDHQRENTHSKHASNDSYKADSGNLNLSNDCSETLIKDTLTTSVKDNKIESSNSKIEEIVIKNDDKKNILEHCECMKKVCDKCNKIRDNQKVQKTESDSLECKEISVNQSTSVSDKLQSSVEHVDGSDLKDHKVNVEKNCDSASTLDSDKKIKTDPIKVVIKDSPMKRNDGNYRGRGRGRGGKGYNFHRYGSNIDPDALCGLIFVDEPLVAKILATMINEFCRYDENLKFICAQYTVDKVADPLTDTREAESEHKLQEEVLKRFRVHECNLLVGTEYLEEGLDLPKCNLVIKWDIPSGYRSHARCRARARAPRSLYILMAPPPPEPLITTLAHYVYIEWLLVKKCGWREPPASEEAEATKFSPLIEAYRPSEAAVNLSSAVALLNRYCAKLPSDTFTRLVPLWTMERINYCGNTLYICTIRLPINCPLKHHIIGHPMPSRVLARRAAALQACKALHCAGELDDNLLPIGKEGFKAVESDWLSLPLASDIPKSDPLVDSHTDQFEPRPGTTKRKQYYYKKMAKALTDCRPVVGVPCLAYQINAWLACPLPERHNTRGRKLHPPETYAEGFAILTSKPIQKIPVFPIFTRSGEVRVAIQKLPGCVVISRQREKLIHCFMKYTFAEVLRVHNHLMLFDKAAVQSRNSYYVVPTTKISDADGKTSVVIDWSFLQLIYEHASLLSIENNIAQNSSQNNESHIDHEKPKESESVKEMKHINPEELKESESIIEKNVQDNENQINHEKLKLEQTDNTVQAVQEENCSSSNVKIVDETNSKEVVAVNRNSAEVSDLSQALLSRDTFVFDSEKFRDAVVMPWYRNQDQPQYFYVAEICWKLSPLSEFPSNQHATFEEYYRHKYGAKITQSSQPLLDVDHTSARLNLLTPRFVNRKGVALPTSSERTKKAKRESLEQKQILVPELCYTHPFRGALWRAAVALPCVLYRINSLLLADEIRKSVALCVALGTPTPRPDFEWPALDFGWSLAEVLSCEDLKTIKGESEEKKTAEEKTGEDNKVEENPLVEVKDETGAEEKTANELLKEKEDAESEGTDIFEVGMWSNEMAANVNLEPEPLFDEDDSIISANTKLPPNLTICTSIGGGADWNLAADEEPSPRRYGGRGTQERRFSSADSVISYASSDFDDSENSSNTSSDVDDHIHINAIDTFSEKDGVRIEFKSGNEAEAIDIAEKVVEEKKEVEDVEDVKLEKETDEKSYEIFKDYFYSDDNQDEGVLKHLEAVKKRIITNEHNLKNNGILVKPEHSLEFLNPHSLTTTKKPSASDENIDVIEMISNDVETPVFLDDSLDDKNNEVELFVEEDNVNPFPILSEVAWSKNELLSLYNQMFPYDNSSSEDDWFNSGLLENGVVTLDNLEKNKRKILRAIKNSLPREEWIKYNFFNMKDIDETEEFESDFAGYRAASRVENSVKRVGDIVHECKIPDFKFSFDYQPELLNHPGPSPSLILQGLTMSNANDGINLERLETIGDSFLKYAITTYLYCTYHNIHEGKLSHLRSKQVSNLNLYRLGRRKSLGSRMVAYKFEPHDNWLPPCHRVPPHLERALIDTHIPSTLWNIADMPPLNGLSKEEVEKIVKEKIANHHTVPNKFDFTLDDDCPIHGKNQRQDTVDQSLNPDFCTCDYILVKQFEDLKDEEYAELAVNPCFVPYNLITQHSIPDKSVADCVEALIGAYLIECGPRGALLFMAWLGIRVLPKEEIVLPADHPFVKFMEESELNPKKSMQRFDLPLIMEEPIDIDPIEDNDIIEEDDSKESKSDLESDPYDNQEENSDFDEDDSWNWDNRIPGSLKPEKNKNGEWIQIRYGVLEPPPSPLLRFVPDPEGELMQMLSGYEGLEKTLNYRFNDRCYLLQAMTHASYTPNRLTDCYQRLEFLGDAVLDYLITRQLYEDPRRHSPGALTDLRSALVNNTIFASLAVRHGMHKYFRHLSPGLNEVLARFVKIQEENGHSISEDHYLIQEDECEQVEDVEVPKALGDLFESIAGAIFLDSSMSLDVVWKVYHALMQREIDAFSESVPKSPVRELLEMEPETAKFGKPEKLADGRRVRVTVEVLGVGVFKGVGRNYRIAKCTAAKCALRRLGSSSSRRHKK